MHCVLLKACWSAVLTCNQWRRTALHEEDAGQLRLRFQKLILWLRFTDGTRYLLYCTFYYWTWCSPMLTYVGTTDALRCERERNNTCHPGGNLSNFILHFCSGNRQKCSVNKMALGSANGGSHYARTVRHYQWTWITAPVLVIIQFSPDSVQGKVIQEDTVWCS